MPYTSEVIRGRIIGMWECWWPTSEIAIVVGYIEDCVRYWIHRLEEEGENGLKTRRKSGARKETTREQYQTLLDLNRRDPFLPVSSMARNLNLPVCACSVRNLMHSAGIHHRRPEKKNCSQMIFDLPVLHFACSIYLLRIHFGKQCVTFVV